MPVPLPPALVGSVFLPRPCTSVGQSVRPSTAPAQLTQGLVCGPGLGLFCLARSQPVESGCGVGKVLGILLLLTPEDQCGFPCSQRPSHHWKVARGAGPGRTSRTTSRAKQLSCSSSKSTLPLSPGRYMGCGISSHSMRTLYAAEFWGAGDLGGTKRTCFMVERNSLFLEVVPNPETPLRHPFLHQPLLCLPI